MTPLLIVHIYVYIVLTTLFIANFSNFTKRRWNFPIVFGLFVAIFYAAQALNNYVPEKAMNLSVIATLGMTINHLGHKLLRYFNALSMYRAAAKIQNVVMSDILAAIKKEQDDETKDP